MYVIENGSQAKNNDNNVAVLISTEVHEVEVLLSKVLQLDFKIIGCADEHVALDVVLVSSQFIVLCLGSVNIHKKIVTYKLIQ